ncbi:MAG: phosphate ABC transporter permease subunit PstC [bacterium]|nr:phosphate ABC transporter permease subunit PstC [bacterium]MDD6225017.1 phosphate ABC transporter permease subunit PstC [bacterium]MDY3861623.1 phosphate ABC transporter permease subunit PstC [Ruminococcus sp.]
MNRIKETAMQGVFFLTAITSIAAVVLICIFLFCNGIPAMAEIGFFDFVGGQKWSPTNVPASYGILYMIIGSIYVTAGAVLVGVPIGVLTAVFLARFCPQPIYKFLKPATELLAGIPSIVYGFFGLMVVVPFIREHFGGSGSSLMAASLVLGIMILPTIIGVSESSIRAVPESYYEGALALGATRERSVFKAVFPAAKSGVLAGIVLGIGRAIGETMAVVLIAGNQVQLPESLTDGVRTLTANIVLEMGYATGLHRQALIATAVVLFVFILLITVSMQAIKSRSENRG